MKLNSQPVPLIKIDEGTRARQQYSRKDNGTSGTTIDELIHSIKSHGLINAICLADKSKISDKEWLAKEETDPDKPYLLLAGGRRFHAYIKGKLDYHIDSRIYDRMLTPEELKMIELEENLQRLGLTYPEEARLKKEIHDLQQRIHGKAVRGSKQGHSVQDTADMLEEDRATVVKDINIAKAMERMPQLATAKSRAEAEKMLRRLKQDYDTENHATRIQKTRTSTPLDEQRKALYDSFVVMDFFEGIKKVPDKSISIVEIDPPYAIKLQEEKRAHKTTMLDYNEIDSRDYIDFMQRTFEECYRVMKEHSWMIVWFGPDPWFSLMLGTLREAGFEVRGLPGIWSKGRGQTQQPALYLANTYEMFFYARKGKPGIRKQGRNNVFDFPPLPGTAKIHPTERPVELIEEILHTFSDPGGRLLVPFLGSGNSLLAASNVGMQAFGYELSQAYKDRFVVRVNEAQPGAYYSYGRKEKES